MSAHAWWNPASICPRAGSGTEVFVGVGETVGVLVAVTVAVGGTGVFVGRDVLVGEGEIVGVTVGVVVGVAVGGGVGVTVAVWVGVATVHIVTDCGVLAFVVVPSPSCP